MKQPTPKTTQPKEERGEIIRIVPSDIRADWCGKRFEYGNYVVVRTHSGREHTFINGSINGIKEEHRYVGRKGKVTWQRSASFNLPFFTAA